MTLDACSVGASKANDDPNDFKSSVGNFSLTIRYLTKQIRLEKVILAQLK